MFDREARVYHKCTSDCGETIIRGGRDYVFTGNGDAVAIVSRLVGDELTRLTRLGMRLRGEGGGVRNAIRMVQ